MENCIFCAVHEKSILEHCKNPKPLVEYRNNMHDVYKNIDEFSTDKEQKVFIVFDDIFWWRH